MTIEFLSAGVVFLEARVVLVQTPERLTTPASLRTLDGREWDPAALRASAPELLRLDAGRIDCVAVAQPAAFMALMRDVRVKDRQVGTEYAIGTLLVPNLEISAAELERGFAAVDTRITTLVSVKMLTAGGAPAVDARLWCQRDDTVMTLVGSDAGDCAFLAEPGHYAMAIEGSGRAGRRELEVLPTDRGVKEVVVRDDG